MADKIWFAVLIVVAYIIGSINPSIIISKIKGEDIRKQGSGNAGATNMLRTYGKFMGVTSLLLDAAKGVLAVGIGMIVQHFLTVNGMDGNLAVSFKYITALFVAIGHSYPVFFGFKGGKGIATSGAAMFMMDWRVGLVVLIGAISVMAITRIVSLGSMVGALLYIAGPLFFTYVVDKTENWWFIIVTILMALLAVYRHKANIVRIINGTESKLGQKAKK